MNWQTFKEHLEAHTEQVLQFRYAPDTLVEASYHITEIKQAPITSVDCGGVMNAWTEVIMQLWVPDNEVQDRAMQVNKALSIVALVEKVLPLNPNAIVKIEFGNSQFDTRQMLPNAIITEGENLVVDLQADSVQCKAIERGGSCGTNEQGEECCTPVVEVKPKVQLKNLVSSASACTPGSGCC
ncbi:DUF6428 family protein [uncultured Mucilaginibacter sp.]|uniref:DUF6428 family protein n=1 Tax=uncultured Mucilaginibacter sp. TaxID=797541 RepID=UPI0025E592EC|nr:DUF6428 family protein [uncultured Mucilaginibacter sp.]